jgi:hypothetical protein
MAKIRGRKRLARRLDAFAKECACEFPDEQRFADGTGRGYWHAHVPIPTAALMGPQSRRALRHQVVNTLLSIADQLVRTKPSTVSSARIVVVFESPNLAESQVIVFFSEPYFNAFWSRVTPTQTWSPLSTARSFVRERRVAVSAPFVERGYREVVSEDGVTITSEIWAIGELVA